jgi:predicted nucleic acid-binding protein
VLVSAASQSRVGHCPLTENGLVRVLSQAAYPSGRRTPAEVVEVLGALKAAFSPSHQFWPDDLSLADASIFDSALIAGPRLITDAYLLGLASHHMATLVSFDQSLPWHAIRGGSVNLIHLPL